MIDLSSIKSKKILVVGDIMLDVYYRGSVNRISPEAPVPVFKYSGEDYVLGGAANVANNLVFNGQQVTVLSVIGDDKKADILIDALKKSNIKADYILKSKERVTTVKTRLVEASNQQIIRIDEEEDSFISTDLENRIVETFGHIVKKFDMVVISDYMKGVLTERVTQTIINLCCTNNIKVLIDPKDKNIDKYRNADLIKPNLKELQMFLGIKIKNKEELYSACKEFKEKTKIKNLVVTTGEKGMVLLDEKNQIYNVKALAKEVYDVTGAGDTVLAYIAMCVASDISYLEAVELANFAASLKVMKHGTSVVTIDEINLALNVKSKLKDFNEIKTTVESLKNLGKKIVFTNGCFDILHAGHISYLRRARKIGDVLILGLNSDESVRRLKGNDRPINDENSRIEVLKELECIDYIVVFGEDTPYNLINIVKPDVLVKGGDYTPDSVVGKDIVEEYGGKVEILSFVQGKSTTNIVNKIRNNG